MGGSHWVSSDAVGYRWNVGLVRRRIESDGSA
jgi:hypothetical protein